MKRIISFALATFFVFLSVFSTSQFIVYADSTLTNWGGQPYTDKYAYTDSNKQLFLDDTNTAGIYQGSDNLTFAKDAPIATIYINEDMVHRVASQQDLNKTGERILSNSKVVVEELWKKNVNTSSPSDLRNYLMVGNPKDISGFLLGGSNYLMFNQKDARESDAQGTGIGLKKGSDNYLEGELISYKFLDAAEYAGEKADVVITYSDLHIVLQSNIADDKYNELDKFMICSGNDVRTHSNKGLTNDAQRYGIKINAKVQVLDKNGNIIDGIFYFKAADIDVYRGDGFDKLYDANKNYNYSEQVRLNSGYVPGAIKVYLPGGEVDKSVGPPDNKENKQPGYKARVTESSGTYLFQPQTPETKDEQFSIYSGFLSAINNSQGANVTVWSSAANQFYNTTTKEYLKNSVETYLLAGNAGGQTKGVWYNLKSTTGVGGNIQTTTNGNQGSTPGRLNDSGTVMGPTTITVSGGRTVTYSMKAEPGFVLDFVKTADNTLDYSGGSYVTTTISQVGDYYTFTFSDINMDHAIHVEWKDTNQYKDTPTATATRVCLPR